MTIDIHSLAAAYALGAVDADERARFEAHLEHCEECRRELPGFIATATRLGESVAQAPPSDLRDRVLRGAATTKQERPNVTSISTRSRVRRAVPRMALAAAALLAIISFGGFVTERNQNAEMAAERDTMVAVMTADDSVVKKSELNAGGTLQLVASRSEDRAVVITTDLPDLDDGRVYQVWAITGDTPKSAGLLAAGHDVGVMTGAERMEAVAITVEPRGGSEQPTTTPVAKLDTI